MTHDIGDDLVAITGTDRWLDEIASGDAAPSDALGVGLARWLEDLAPKTPADPAHDARRVGSTRSSRNRRLVMGALVSATVLAGAGTAAAASAPHSVLHRILFGGTSASTSDHHPDPTRPSSMEPSTSSGAAGTGRATDAAAARPTSSFHEHPPAVARATTAAGQGGAVATSPMKSPNPDDGASDMAADDGTATDNDATHAPAESTPEPRTSTSESVPETVPPASASPAASDTESASDADSTDPAPDATPDATEAN